MASEDFSYDAETFVVGEAGLGVDFRKLEADYAELYMEVVSDGHMTDERRARLDRAAEVFGLDRGRLAQIEQAMQAELEARRPTQPPENVAPLSVGAARILVPEERLMGLTVEVDLTDVAARKAAQPSQVASAVIPAAPKSAGQSPA